MKLTALFLHNLNWPDLPLLNSHLVSSYYPVLTFHALSFPAIFCHVLSCHVLSGIDIIREESKEDDYK